MTTDIDVTRFIKGHDKITNVFGYWPSFHDAEIYEITLWRGDAKPAEKCKFAPEITTKIHLFEMSKQTDSTGQFTFSKFTLVTLKFYHIDDLKLEDFNHQNVIYDLSFQLEQRGFYTNGEPMIPYIIVKFGAAFGADISFKCLGVEVVDAIPTTADRVSHR